MRAGPAWALAVVALAGCGSGDGVSRAEFAARAQRICVEASRTTAPVQRQIREAARLPEPALVFRRTSLLQHELAALEAEAVDRLDATPHPEDDEELDRWLVTLRRARAAREELAEAYGARDLERISRTATHTDRLGRRADDLARRLGTPACVGLA